MTAHVSAEVRAESTRRAKRRVRRWKTILFPLVIVGIGLLSTVVLAVAMEGLG